MAAMDIDSEVKSNEDDTKVDEALYSRQLYVIDHESMKKMQQSSVLIAGMNGLGVEIAKNTILAGVKSVTILDNNIVKINDLSSNFYLTPQSIGKQTRAQCCIDQLKSLNPYVTVNIIKSDLQTLIQSKNYDVIVLVNYPLATCIKYNQIAHALNLKFISCDTCGVFGQVFVDFANQFECTDLTGEPPMQGMVINVSKAEKGVVQVHEDSRHGLSDGDFVRFEEIEGMQTLNTLPPMQIHVTTPFAFEIGDTTPYNDYTGNGLFFQVKQGAKLSFHTLSEIISMKKNELIPAYPNVPKILQTDFGKDPYEQHLFYLALQEYLSKNNSFPAATSIDDANAVYKIFVRLCSDSDIEHKEEEKTNKIQIKYRELARCSGAVINPMCAFLGGIVGQEILKACSHKFTPLQQLLYFDAFECLPVHNNYSQYTAQNCRYDDNIAVFGMDIQEKVLNARMFLVGAGAIGCEMLKNWAMMGVGCKNGNIVVTDMDQIETSNLNRQFLFRKKDVGCAKSISAGQAVQVMNSDMNIVAHENRVGADSEHVYNFSFWSALSGVCTALDNVSARLYVDAQCVYYNKPLLESGTLGTKGNTQIVVPCLTESYGSTRDPDEKSVPICTLKNFPNKIEHTIQWARDDFEGEFKQSVIEMNNFLENGDKYLTELHKNNPAEELMILKNISVNLDLKNGRPLTFEQCVHWARNKFEKDFSNRIKQLLYNFPHDAVTSEGAKFWSPPKRAPDAILFDENDMLHMEYVIAAANLRAFVYGLKGICDVEEIKKLLSTCIVPAFDIDKNAKIAVSDEEEKEAKKKDVEVLDYDAEVEYLIKSLPDRKELVGMKLKTIEFEKDNDKNFHMDFVFSAANLRARNYRIGLEKKHEIKKIAGKIIPAIATTTAAVTGLISLEFYKLIQSENKIIDDYRSSYVNLALPLVTMSEPVGCRQTTIYKKGKEWNYSLWDVIKIKNGKNFTVSDLLNYFDTEWDCDLNMISYGNAMLYAFYMNPVKLMKRKNMKLKDLCEQVCKIKIDENVMKRLNFEVNVDYQNVPDDGDEEPMLPTICLYLD